MKKITIILAVVLMGVFLVAFPAMAMKSPYTHGDFASNSKGCGDCHVTHSAGAAKLLNTTSTYQTTFCLGCHGKMSPFDVRIGQIITDAADGGGAISSRWDWSGVSDTGTSANTSYSLSGGFQYAGDFDVIEGDGSAMQVTSVHNVQGLSDTASIAGVTEGNWIGDTIPGGTNSITFECGSCHDPHAGGAYSDDQSDKNPRLLKEDILGRSDMRVKMKFDQATNTVTRYTYGFNTWCGACHDVFDTSIGGLESGGWRSGYDKTTIARDKFMHKFGVHVDPSQYAGTTDPYTVKYLALEAQKPDGSADTTISCITCHRAHGSSADVSGLEWTRYASYKDGSGATTTTGSGSALLRLPDRDVCYECHDIANKNHSVTH